MMRELFAIVVVVVLLAACGSKNNVDKSVQSEADSMLAAYHYSDSLYAACGRIDTAAYARP